MIFFSNPTDYLTFKPFVNAYKERFKEHFGKVLKKMIADSGYGNEENYEFVELYNKRKNMSKTHQKPAVLPQILVFVVIFHLKSEKHPRHDFFCPVNLKLVA
jgi:hypothetical protein